MAVAVLFDKAYHSSQLSVNTGSEQTVCTISSGDLVAGHRYLVFGTIHTLGGSHGAYCRLKFGGVADNNIRGDYSSYSGGSNVHQYKGSTLWTAVAGQDITLTVARSNSNNGVARNCSLMAIDLDSAGLQENEDWFHAVDSTRSRHIHHSFSQPSAVIENQSASTLSDGETFTIDDNEGNVQIFEFDLSGNGVTPGNIAVSLNPGDSSSTVRTAIVNAINGASPLEVFAGNQGSTSYTLVRPSNGAAQKVDLSDTVANSNWVFSSWRPAVLTFTPDGTSDYLVIGTVGVDNIPGRMIMRLRDVTNGNTIFQSGIGSGNLGTEEHCYTGFGIMQAPAAVPTSLVTEYRSFSAAEKDEARIVVIKLNSFNNFTYFDIDMGSVAPSNTNRTQRGSTLDFTPDSTGEILVLGAVQSEGDGNFSSTSRGIAGDVTQDGTKIWDSQSVNTQWHGDNTNYTGTDGSVVGPWIFEFLEGETPDVSQEWKLFSTSPSTSQNDLRQMMLLVMSTQEVISPPDTKASNPSPSNGSTDISPTIDLSFTSGVGGGTITHDIYFGISQSGVTNATNASPEFKASLDEGVTSFDPKPLGGTLSGNITYYWRVDVVNEGGTLKGDTWSFTVFPGPSQVIGHSPADLATEIDPFDVTISWAASTGDGAITYDAYFGTDESAVINGTGGTQQSNQSGTSIDVGDLDVGTTYYWRVNSLNAAATTTGDTVEFTTLNVPPQSEGPNPLDGATGILPNKILVWDDSIGGGTIVYHVYFGTNETDVTNGTGGTSKGSQSGTSYEPGLMEEFTTYYWRIDVENEAGLTTGDVWEFATAEAVDIPEPSQAENPSPSDNATELGLNITLMWDAGSGIGSIFNNVYLGTSPNDLDMRSNFQAATSYSIPEQLQGGTTYYWRVDSADTFGGVTTGEVWSFTTKSFAPKVVNALNRPFPVAVEVHFDTELLEEESGTLNPDNYTFNHGAYATSVTLINDKQVRLTVENLFEFDTFSVTVNDQVRSFSEEGVNSSFNSYTFALADRPVVDEGVQSFSSANGRLKSGSVVTKIEEDVERWYIQTESGMDIVSKTSLRNEGFILDGYGFNTIFVG